MATKAHSGRRRRKGAKSTCIRRPGSVSNRTSGPASLRLGFSGAKKCLELGDAAAVAERAWYAGGPASRRSFLTMLREMPISRAICRIPLPCRAITRTCPACSWVNIVAKKPPTYPRWVNSSPAQSASFTSALTDYAMLHFGPACSSGCQ